MYTLFRDDDISVTSDINLLIKVHNLFITYNRIHTVAVLMNDLWENKEVWYWLMTAENLEIGLHGWTHLDYGALPDYRILSDIDLSLSYWDTRRSKGGYKPKQIKTFFPPWNSTSPVLEDCCKLKGLNLDSRVGGDVYNFHYWACQDYGKYCDLQEAFLK